MSRHIVKVLVGDNGCRIDRWLRTQYGVPYTLLQKLFRKKEITVNAQRVKPTYLLQEGDAVTCYGVDLTELRKDCCGSKRGHDKLLRDITNQFLYQDENLLAINKPYAVAVQNGSKINLSIDTILPDLHKEHKLRLVHRLDRYTTGVLILSKSVGVSNKLLSLFKEHKISKQYIAVLNGIPKRSEGVLKSKIGKDLVGDKEKMVVSNSGKEAITKYKVLSVSKEKQLSLVAFFPVTGRTHQIRIHAHVELGCPILGDNKYYKVRPHKREKMHLHSYKTFFMLGNKDYNFTAPLPDHICDTLKQSNLEL